MMRRSLGIFVVCAVGATALILPPGIAPTSSEDDGFHPSIVNPKNQLIQLPCPACAFSTKGHTVEKTKDFDDLYWIQGGSNDVVLNFSVSDDGLALELGGQSIYTPNAQFNALLSGERIYVHQVPAAASITETDSDDVRRVPLEITSIGLSTEAEVRASPEGDVIVQLQLRIMALEGQFMHFDGVRIHLLRTNVGELLILRLDNVPDSTSLPFPSLSGSAPSPHPPTMGMPDMKECKMLPTAFCKLRDMVEAKFDSIRQGDFQPGPPQPDFDGHPPHTPPHINSHNLDFDAPPLNQHGRPHHVRPHGEHYHHHGHRGVHSIIRSIIGILIPVMAGITVGLLVSLLGMLFGRMIGFLWLRAYPTRRQHRRHRRRGICLSRDDTVIEEGKILLHEDDIEPLPAYEDAPSYEEVETRPK
jgi:hypothetical protein